MSPANTKHRINVFIMFKDQELTERVKELDNDSFNIISINKPSEIKDRYNSVIIVEKRVYLENTKNLSLNDGSIIIVTNEEINLKDNLINKVPKELFLTKYLEEFIYWTVEKTRIILEKKKRQLRRTEVEKLITELKDVSRCSIFT